MAEKKKYDCLTKSFWLDFVILMAILTWWDPLGYGEALENAVFVVYIPGHGEVRTNYQGMMNIMVEHQDAYLVR